MSKKILAVDDSRSIRQMVKFTLEQAGFEVVDAIDGNDGLSKLNEHTIDLVITDLIMPEMDGIELITHVRQKPEYKFVPILVLTTESNEEKKQEARKAGATGWIIKPFKPKQLVKIVQKLLGME